MTANDAYKILSKENPCMKVRTCLDFGTFYGFCLAPLDIKDDEPYDIGTCLDTVDKKTGHIFIFNILDDIDKYELAVEVNVDTIFDIPVSKI